MFTGLVSFTKLIAPQVPSAQTNGASRLVLGSFSVLKPEYQVSIEMGTSFCTVKNSHPLKVGPNKKHLFCVSLVVDICFRSNCLVAMVYGYRWVTGTDY